MSAPVPFQARTSVMALLASLRPDEHYPLSAMVEIADRCNEACVHCYQVQGQKGELETAQWRAIFDELAEMGVFLLTISGGEATLRKDFLELVEYAREKRFAVKIYTNGLNMSEALAQRLGELAVQEVQISLYSHQPEVHDAVTRVPGSFVKTTAAARHLVEAGVPVVLKTPLMRVNAEGIDEYVDLVTSIGAEYTLDPQVDPREDGDRAPLVLALDDDAHVRVMSHPKLQIGDGKQAPPTRDVNGSICGACSGHVHIEANGELRPCTLLQVPVGNAAVEGVREAWEKNPVGRSIRDITWGDLTGCPECDLRDYCGRCFANARMEAGDALAPYESACRRARLSYEVKNGVAPKIKCGSRADSSVGPYRREADGEFVCFEAKERVLATVPDWVHPPEELIQLGRGPNMDGRHTSSGPVDIDFTGFEGNNG